MKTTTTIPHACLRRTIQDDIADAQTRVNRGTERGYAALEDAYTAVLAEQAEMIAGIVDGELPEKAASFALEAIYERGGLKVAAEESATAAVNATTDTGSSLNLDQRARIVGAARLSVSIAIEIGSL